MRFPVNTFNIICTLPHNAKHYIKILRKYQENNSKKIAKNQKKFNFLHNPQFVGYFNYCLLLSLFLIHHFQKALGGGFGVVERAVRMVVRDAETLARDTKVVLGFIRKHFLRHFERVAGLVRELHAILFSHDIEKLQVICHVVADQHRVSAEPFEIL